MFGSVLDRCRRGLYSNGGRARRTDECRRRGGCSPPLSADTPRRTVAPSDGDRRWSPVGRTIMVSMNERGRDGSARWIFLIFRRQRKCNPYWLAFYCIPFIRRGCVTGERESSVRFRAPLNENCSDGGTSTDSGPRLSSASWFVRSRSCHDRYIISGDPNEISTTSCVCTVWINDSGAGWINWVSWKREHYLAESRIYSKNIVSRRPSSKCVCGLHRL